MNLQNKNILITGASGGIGNAVLKLLYQNSNSNIFAQFYKNPKVIEEVIVQSKANIVPLQCDLASKSEIKSMLEKISLEAGSLDVIINAAGIEGNPQDPINFDEWRETWDINLIGPIEVCRLGVQILNKGGVIANVSSIMGKADVAVPIELTAYAVGKTALNKFTLNLAYNYASKLRAFTVSPGYTLTKMWDFFDKDIAKQMVERTPIKRFIQPDEVAKVIISSIENDSITGCDIIIDGGISIKNID